MLPVFSELTETDLNRLRLIVQEEIKKEIEPIKADIVLLKTDVAWIKGKLESVDKQFDSIDKQFDNVYERFGGVHGQITHVTYLTYGLIALIVAAVAIPQIIIMVRSGRDRALEKQVEKLTQEIETLKQQLIVNP